MQGIIYFLFLCYDKVHNGAVWQLFFRDAAMDKFAIYIHASARSSFRSPDFLPPFTLIETVASRWCDVVQPMGALLEASLETSNSSYDYFIYLSSDSIPVKPFSYVLDNIGLPTNGGSRSSWLCITPTTQWLKFQVNTSSLFRIKHHQWLALNRHRCHKSRCEIQDP